MRTRAAIVGCALCLACEGEAKPQPSKPSAAKATDLAPVVPTQCASFEALDVESLPALPTGEHLGVFDQVWRRVLDKYYDPTIGCLDWPEIRKEYGAKVAAASNAKDAYRTMNEMLELLEQSHFKLYGPESSDETPQGPATPDLQIRLIDGVLVVARSGENSVAPGAVLVAVDGEDTEAIIKKAQARSERPAKRAFLAARAAAAWISCPSVGDTHKLTLEQPSGGRVDATVACKTPPGQLESLGNLSNVPTHVTHRMLDGTDIGVLGFNVWMLPMRERIKTGLDELRAAGMKKLVLDLRGNPGGVGQMAVPVARMLLREEATLGKLQYRKFVQNFNVTPDPDAFGGPIAVLVDEGTASTSEIFAAGMRDLGRITIVGGGPSTGAALPSMIEQLQGGAMLQYAVGDYHSPKGVAVEGKGIAPDIVVDETREDFAAGRDPVLDAAVAHLQGNKP